MNVLVDGGNPARITETSSDGEARRVKEYVQFASAEAAGLSDKYLTQGGVVRYQKLDSTILVVKSAEDRL
jgi:hypothetical protein